MSSRQRKFTDLSGAAEAQGDLSSVVLHSLKVTHVRSSFPIGECRSVQIRTHTLNSLAHPFQLNIHACIVCMFAALGAKISCVDDCTYSSTGEPFSTVLLPETESNRVKELQADDTSLTYEFARKFPGYTSGNLATKVCTTASKYIDNSTCNQNSQLTSNPYSLLDSRVRRASTRLPPAASCLSLRITQSYRLSRCTFNSCQIHAFHSCSSCCSPI